MASDCLGDGKPRRPRVAKRASKMLDIQNRDFATTGSRVSTEVPVAAAIRCKSHVCM
jgi:hypothetical protein